MAAVPFLLSWLLKEAPLRTTLMRAPELSAEQGSRRRHAPYGGPAGGVARVVSDW